MYQQHVQVLYVYLSRKELGNCGLLFCKIYIILLLQICVEVIILLLTNDFCCVLLHAGSGRRCIVDVTLDRSEVRTQLRLGGGWFLVLVTTQQDKFSGGFIEYE